MKMRLFVFSILLTSFGLNAQDFSFCLSGKGLLNGSLILNNSVTTSENQDYAFAMSGAGGLGGLFLYNDKIGASIEFLVGNHKGKYNGTTSLGNQKYSSEVNLKTIQIPILFRLDNDEGYLEIGPQLNVITNANFTSNYPIGFNSDVSDEYKRMSISGVLGFGSFYHLGKRSPVTLTFGFRINYGLSDIKGVDPVGTSFAFSTSNQKSILLAAGFNLGLLYELK
jgi:hypothetical protein